MSSLAFRYRAWDGTQAVEPYSPQQVLSALSDTLLHGNIEQALDRALHRGLSDIDGEGTSGLDELRDQLRGRRAAIDDEIARDEALRQLAEDLASSSGGTESMDPSTSRLLDALASRADAARVLAGLPSSQRELIESAIRQRQRSPISDAEQQSSGETEFAGWLDDILQRLDQIDKLEQQLRRVRRVQDVGEIDTELIREVLSSESAERLERLTASLGGFADSGFVRTVGRRQELSARALQHIGDELLHTAFQRIAIHGSGDRRLERRGQHDLTGVSRDYEFGDPLALDLSRTVMRAIRRGAGVPVRVAADDFAIFEREDTARVATLLALDLSRSMGERGYLLAAKKLALAILTLVRTRFPRDELMLAGFSDSARVVTPSELPQLTWDRFGLGTNVQDALRLGRGLLARHRGMQRNLILLTDGEPTAHRDAQGIVHFSHPTTTETLTQTYAEADRLRRDGISLWVCVLSAELHVVTFAEQLAKTARGDLIVTSPDDLSAAIVVRYGARRR